MRPARCLGRIAGWSAMARWPRELSCPCSPTPISSPTPSASPARSPPPTGPLPWPGEASHIQPWEYCVLMHGDVYH
eukprot:40231-Eustigmatos_ZCMA.PRE.1